MPAGHFGLGHGTGAHAPNEYFLIDSIKRKLRDSTERLRHMSITCMRHDINAQLSAVIFPWPTIRFDGDYVAHGSSSCRQNAAAILACIPGP